MSTHTPPEARRTNTRLTIRLAGPSDEAQMIRLAGRDGLPRPTGEVLVAELDDELVAARSLTTGHAIADPFRPTAEIAQLVALRAETYGAGASAARRPSGTRRRWSSWGRGLATRADATAEATA